MEPDQYRRKKRGPLRPREGRPGKLVRQPTETLGMQARRRERQARKMRQQGSRMRQEDRVAGAGGYMTGGQAKIAAKAPPPNKIDAKDFAVLRAEKAKGRGKGLQDEKMKPGKVMKASTGRAIAGPRAGAGLGALGAQPGRKGLTPEEAKKAREKILMDRFKKKRQEERDKPKTPLGKKKKPKPGSYEYQQQQTQNQRPSQILPKKKMGGVMKYDKGGMGEAKGYKKYLEGLKKAEGSVFRGKYKAKEIAKAGGKAALKAAKASRIGKIALGVAGVGIAAKEFLQRKMEKRKRIKREKDAVRGLKENMAVEKLHDGLREMGIKVPKKMGGGMMQRPVMGYKSGTMVKAKCKLGRNKPTKLY